MRKDLAYAIRNMIHSPGVTAVALLTLALGVGANTAMFSVIYAVLLRPLPVHEPERLVTIWAKVPHLNIQAAFVEYNTFAEWWRARSRSFESMAAYTPGPATLDAGNQPQQVRVLRVSASYFSVIGMKPALGRDFRPEEDQPGAARVALLSDGLWKRSFGSSRGVLGRSITLDRNNYTVVGVLPADFDLATADVLTPIAQSTARGPGQPPVGTYARLKRGVSIQAAQSEIDSLCRGWLEKYPYPRDWGARVWPLREFLVREVRTNVLVLEVAVALVLLIACANVANLLLARAGARQREIAVRSALGAGRGRIIRQLLTESALLGIAATALALPLAWASLRALVAAEVALPFLKKVSVNPPVLLFAAGAAALTTILFGLAPAFAASRTSLSENLKEGGRGAGEGLQRRRFRAALVIGEVALALLLVIGAALTLSSLVRLQAVDPGFRPQDVLTASLTLPGASYRDGPARANFFRALLDRISAIPGVKSAGMVSHLPFSGSNTGTDVVVEGAPPPARGDQTIAILRAADPEYFRTLQIPLRRGRFFTPRDPSGGPVAIINESLARRGWPGQDPVGRRFNTGGASRWLTVVGVVADVRSTSLAKAPDLEYYLPHTMYPMPSMSLVIRTQLEPLRLSPAIGSALRELDKDLAFSSVAPLEVSISRSISARRLSATLLGGFAALALLLAAVGVYGIISYSVTRNTREIGVRIALGATRGRIAAGVVGRAALLGAAGVAIGVVASLALTRVLGSMLYSVSPTDPAIFAATSLFLLAVSALAAYVPARRAAAVDPMVALRHE